MKILLTGKNGQLGFELQRSIAALGEVVAVGHADCDLSDAAAVRALLTHVEPDIVINPAAYTAVDKAESDSALAFSVNADAPRVIGEEAERRGAMVIHYSTDYVFAGDKAGAYSELDATMPMSVYGASKLAGELALSAATSRHLILRTGWVVGAHGSNFAKTILRLASDRECLKVVEDQFGAPTSAALLADVTAQLVRQYQRNVDDFPYGTYHVSAGGQTNWHEYACFVLDEALAAGCVLKATPENVTPVPTSEYPTEAVRPANSCLDTEHFRTTFGLHLPHWKNGVRHVLQQLF